MEWVLFQMFKKIERQFEEKRQMILRLSSVIQKEYNTKDENPLACCDVEGKPNQIFNATVSKKTLLSYSLKDQN